MSFKKFLLLWLVAVLFCIMSWGQTGEADSLKALLGAKDATRREALLSNEGAIDCARYLMGRSGEALSSLWMGELRAYDQAATKRRLRRKPWC